MQLTWLVGKRLVGAEKRIGDWAFHFEGDTVLITECLWRLVSKECIVLTSHDHGDKSYTWIQRAGRDEIATVFRDARQEMSGYLYLATIRAAVVAPITNDIQFDFDNALSLIVTFDRGAWCFQSPELNLVSSRRGLAIHTKQSEKALEEKADEPR